jgi:hypothetical protein
MNTSACKLVAAVDASSPPLKIKRDLTRAATETAAAQRLFGQAPRGHSLCLSHPVQCLCAHVRRRNIVAISVLYFQCLEARYGRYQPLGAAGRLEWLLLHRHPRFATRNLLELVSAVGIAQKKKTTKSQPKNDDEARLFLRF